VPGEPIGFVRGKLAEVLFQKDEVEKPLRALSGGEAARLVFAKLSVLKPNVLCSTSPPTTSTSRRSRRWSRARGSTTARCSSSPTTAGSFPSSPTASSRSRRPASATSAAATTSTSSAAATTTSTPRRCSPAPARRSARRRRAQAAPADAGAEAKRTKQLERERDRLTAEIERSEKRIGEINEKFCNPGFFDRHAPGEVKKLENEQRALTLKIDELMAAWSAVEEQLAAHAPA
jgi:hypothetical protein